ncbi:MAG: adenosylcobinamide-phosphate synthase CbiB [Betaproteobacteria bacterium]|nr:adenosylcobinamide-phosphate synthase CbiB [Betaproteobacteria bacterium]
MAAPLIAVLAAILDRLLGEPRRWHPLVGFGRLAQQVEAQLNGSASRRWRGVLAVVLLVGGFIFLIFLMRHSLGVWGWLLDAALLYLAIGAASLKQHADAVRWALADGDLDAARRNVGLIVSRDTMDMDETAVATATIESVLENGCDAVFGALFWFFVAGAPGAVAYRLANTLDAMWGYKTARYLHFGWAAARLDDLLNWIPARLVALTYSILGNTGVAWRCWRSQAAGWESPNAGPVMAAGAGALALQLGGTAIYHGQRESRPDLGAGRAPEAADIARATALVDRGVMLWLVLALIGGWLIA